MSWPRLILIGLVLAGGPVGCGFHPIYATTAPANSSGRSLAAELASIRVPPIQDRLGQQVRNALLQRLSPHGESADPQYSLVISIIETDSNLGYRKDNYATLGNLIYTVRIDLRYGATQLLLDSATTVVSFDYLGPRYASVAMERDARERAATQIADDILGRVSAAIERFRKNPKDPSFSRRPLPEPTKAPLPFDP